MLRNFDNRLNADVIRCLRAMGHGDDLIICDTNFPADSVIPPVQQEVQKVIDKWEAKSWPMGQVERFAFYEKARNAYAVIVTGETRFYGCFILKKGVIPPKA